MIWDLLSSKIPKLQQVNGIFKYNSSAFYFQYLTLTLCFLLSDSKGPPEKASANSSNGSLPPNRKQQVTSNSMPRPLSPDSPEIIDELQRYASATGGSGEKSEKAAEGSKNNLTSAKLLQANGASAGDSFASGNVSHHDASVTNVIQPNMDATAAQDLRTGSKRKASTPPSLEERPSKQPSAGKHSSASLSLHGFPFAPGYGLPPLGLNPAMLGHPLFMGAGSPYFQSPNTQLGDPGYMYPELFGLGGAGAVPSSSSATTTTSTTVSSSSSSSASVKAACSVAGAPPPFMLSPSMAGMAAMLPPGFPLSYSQSLASLYTGSMLPGGLPGQAATPGPGGASFLSQYQGTSASSSCSSSPSSFSPSVRSEGQRGPVLVNGGNISSGSGSGSDDDAEVIEVRGQ